MKSSVRGSPDVSALASLDKNKMAVFVWHYHDDDLPGPDAAIQLSLNNLPFASGEATLIQYRIDADHSNSYATWLKMGSPLPLSAEQYAQLEKTGQLAEAEPSKDIRVKNGSANFQFRLPRQAVSLFIIAWKRDYAPTKQ